MEKNEGKWQRTRSCRSKKNMQQELSSSALTEQTNRLRARLSLLRHKKVQKQGAMSPIYLYRFILVIKNNEGAVPGDRASPAVLTLGSTQVPACRASGNQTWHLGQASVRVGYSHSQLPDSSKLTAMLLLPSVYKIIPGKCRNAFMQYNYDFILIPG